MQTQQHTQPYHLTSSYPTHIPSVSRILAQAGRSTLLQSEDALDPSQELSSSVASPSLSSLLRCESEVQTTSHSNPSLSPLPPNLNTLPFQSTSLYIQTLQIESCRLISPLGISTTRTGLPVPDRADVWYRYTESLVSLLPPSLPTSTLTRQFQR